ncbi:MAG: hypothetical protein WCO30_02610, partial [bacterium]
MNIPFLIRNKVWLAKIIVGMIFLIPMVSFGADAVSTGIVPCGNKIDDTGKLLDACNLNYLFQMLDILMKTALKIAFAVMAVVVMWAGFQYIVSQGNAAKVKAAKDSFKYILYGIAFMLLAWVIVFTLETYLLK